MQPSNTETILQLDREIAPLERQLADLKIRRNAHIPLCGLPPEIIARVLQFVQANCDTGLRDYTIMPRDSSDLHWARLMLVCRRMRDVTIGTPGLWSFIDCRRSDSAARWRELCFARSQNYPLEVDSPGYLIKPASRSSPALQLPGAYLDRAWKAFYRVASDLELGDRSFWAVLETPLPAIKHLRCSLNHTALPSRLLGGRSTSLTHLTLHQISFSHEQAPEFPVLQTLYLRDITVQHASQQFVHLLTHTPCLEMLVISTKGPLSPQIPTEKVIVSNELPRLRTLVVTSTYGGISDLLHILPRPSEHLSIEAVNKEEDEYDPHVYEYLLRFWTKATHTQQLLPNGRIGWADYHCSLDFGSRAFDAAAHDPHVFFSVPFDPFDPMLPHELAVQVETARFWNFLGSEDINLDDLPSIRCLVVNVNKFECLIPTDLTDWIRARWVKGRPLESLEFVVSKAARGNWIFEYADKLRNQGVVHNVTCREH